MKTRINGNFSLFATLLFSVIVSAVPCRCAEENTADSEKEKARARMTELVERFDAGIERYTKTGYTEADLRREFIDEFWEILGWDTRNRRGVLLMQQDMIPEERLRIGSTWKYLDMGPRISGRAAFSIECKSAHESLDKPAYVFQAKRYAYSSTRTEVAVLHNILSLRVYDGRVVPEFDHPETGELSKLRFSHHEYVSKFDLLFDSLSKKAVMHGSLKRMLKEFDPKLQRIAVDRSLIEELDRLRLLLGRDLARRNADLSVEDLNAAASHILNQVLFTRILEDRDIITTGRLRDCVHRWKGDAILTGKKTKAKGKQVPKSLHEIVLDEFADLRAQFNGIVFGEHAADSLSVSDETLWEMIMALYPPRAPYDFSSMPQFVLGNVHEHMLGKRLAFQKGRVELEEKPEVRESGGVFYTPEWTVNLMLDRSLSPRLTEATPEQISELRLVDPACGCGAFLIATADRLFARALAYYRKHPERIENTDTAFPSAYQTDTGEWKLSALKKAEIVKDCIHGVDIDPTAVELTIAWLYIQILEGEGSAIVDRERNFKIPNRVEPKRKVSFKLPTLTDNIVCANALVEPDISDDQVVRKRVSAFDWRDNDTRMRRVMSDGGFDLVIGNPPYLSQQNMVKLIPDQTDYLKKTFKSMQDGQPDMAYAFVERGSELLKPDGMLSFILTNRIIYNRSASNLRELISGKGQLKELINFGPLQIFEDAKVNTAILTMTGKKQDEIKYARLFNDASYKIFLESIPLERTEQASFFVTICKQENIANGQWFFPRPSFAKAFEAMQKQTNTLRKIADPFQGIASGMDKVFVVKLRARNEKKCTVYSKYLDSEIVLETDSLRPYISGRDTRRYGILTASRCIIYPYDENGEPLVEAKLESLFPLTYAYLDQCKDVLSFRKKSKSWYLYRDPCNMQYINKQKLHVALARKQGKAGIDLEGGIAFSLSGLDSGIVVTDSRIPLHALLGLLNSDMVYSYFETIAPNYNLSFPYRTIALENLPVRTMTEETVSQYQAIAEVVKKILAAKKINAEADTSALENEVEGLVRKLYGLPVEEKTVQPGKILRLPQPDVEEEELHEVGMGACLSAAMVA